MKYILLLIFALIIASLIYKYIFADDEPVAFTTAWQAQSNPFTTPKDSADVIWKRAKQYLDNNQSLISAGNVETTDSSYFIPYYNSHKKGNSIRIERHTHGDSTSFYVQWWYSQTPSIKGAKEIALFMQQNIRKYDYK